MQKTNIHLISDFTCETLMSISNVISTQFQNIRFNRMFWPFVRNINQIDGIIESLKQNNGIVLLSILDIEIEERIKEEVAKIENCTLILAMEYIIGKCANYLNLPTPHSSRKGIEVDDSYLEKIVAMRYTINHDDGKMLESLNEADIILIGPSRASKTPTSVYLSYRGYKVGNVPFIKEELMPDLGKLKDKVIIGLTIEAERLFELRGNRILSNDLKDLGDMSYSQIEFIVEELRRFRRYVSRFSVPLVDVTRRSVEEVASLILRIYKNQKSR